MLREIIASLIIVFSFSLLSTNCNNFVANRTDSVYMDYDYHNLGYKLFEPNRKHFLSYDLEEISGLTYYKNGEVAAIEDEQGILYFINTETGDIKRRITFGRNGDYEGVEFVDDQVYILKSDGDIYNFRIADKERVEADKKETVLSRANDAEGLGYDGKYLLVALKGSGDTKNNKAKGKAIYTYDIGENKLSQKELFSFKEDDLTEFIRSRKFFRKVNDFDPSAIAKHPLTGDYYVLSADKVLAVFSPEYKIKEVIRLNSITYNQAEGICFAPDGTLYISSEGAGGKGKLMVINYNKHTQ